MHCVQCNLAPVLLNNNCCDLNFVSRKKKPLHNQNEPCRTALPENWVIFIHYYCLIVSTVLFLGTDYNIVSLKKCVNRE